MFKTIIKLTFKSLNNIPKNINVIKNIKVHNKFRKINILRLPVIQLLNTSKNYKYMYRSKAIIALTILHWLGFEGDDEEKETELIMTLKRAVLCTQREEYDKAEQMLHIALRLAQSQQNSQGILYCYDLMANLAMDRYQLQKAGKLFVSVMQMLLGVDVPENDIRVIHVSLKLARISHLLAEEVKAEMGYQWCLDKIQNKKNDSLEYQILYGVIQDWYSQFLLDRGDIAQSLEHLQEAYKVCCNIDGKNTKQGMLLLNDLGITTWRAGDITRAEEFLQEAKKIGKSLDDQTNLGVIYANLGLIYLQKGLMDDASKYCKDAWLLGKKYANTESIEQANYCLEQIKQIA